MKLIVGLGNPGKKYERARHNIGFEIIDNLQSTIGNFSDWKKVKKFGAEISKGRISGEEAVLVKPQTFMNKSGKAVKSLTKNYKLSTKNLIIVHDDIDLPLGKIRISIGRGSAGHKGVESIIKESGNKNFVRFRIGIQPKNGKPKNPEKFVLQNFFKEEEKILKDIIKETTEAIEFALKEGMEKAMSKFNQ